MIRLLNRAVPVIALQLSAFELDASVGLHFIKVLDIYEETETPDDGPAEGSSRGDWEKRSSPQSLAVMDNVIEMLTKAGLRPQVTYNKFHVALGTTGYQFAWFHPRKAAPYCPMNLRNEPTERDRVIARLREVGLDAAPCSTSQIRLRLTGRECEEYSGLITEVLQTVEAASRR